MPTTPARLSVARLVHDLPRLMRSPFDVLAEWHRHCGDVVRMPFGHPPHLHLHSPDDIRHVLMVRHANYRRAGGERGGSRLLGRGLLRSNGERYRRQRALIGPTFARPNLEKMAGVMAAEAAAGLAELPEGAVDLSHTMSVLTLRMLVRAQFAADWSQEAPGLVDDLLTCLRYIHPMTLVVLPRWIPTPARRKYERAVARIEGAAYGLIERRRQEADLGDDLLSTLVRARDAEGTSLTDTQLRDEVMTMLLAGHATTAAGLAWLWHEAMRRPDLLVRLRAEADQVLGPERLPGLAEVRRLELAEAAFREALRLHTPVWGFGRRALADDRLPSGTDVAAGTIVTILPPVIHRRADLFPEPGEFRPERFLRDTRALLPAGSFLAFGVGPRSCIGEGFAMLEAGILIGMMVRQFDFEPLSEPPVTPETLIVHRPRHGVWVRLRRRPQC